MKEYNVSKEIHKKLSLPLLSFLGKSLTEEYSKTSKSDKETLFEKLDFDFDDGYESFTEKTIEKFIEECVLKPNTTINFSMAKGDKSFSVHIEYGTGYTDAFKIMIPEARFSLRSHTADQVWSEGITSKFLKLIEEFDISQIKENTLEVKTNEKPLEVKTNEKPNHSSTFLKNHLPQIIIGIVTSIVGGIIVLWYFTNLGSP